MTTSAQDTEARMQQAQNDYAKHVIVQSSADRWKLKRPGTGDLWAEVAVLAKGTLLVHGDRDPMKSLIIAFARNRDEARCPLPFALIFRTPEDAVSKGLPAEGENVNLGMDEHHASQ